MFLSAHDSQWGSTPWVIVSAVFVMFVAGCSSKENRPAMQLPEAVAVRTATATTATVPLQLSAIGNVESIVSVDVRPRLAAQIEKVHFQEGQGVRSGDLLFELEKQPYMLAIEESEANLAHDIALVAQYRANLARDEAQLRNAQSRSERAQILLKERLTSREDTDTAVATAEGALASRDANQAAVASAEAEVRSDRAKLEAAKLQLSYAKVRAPVSGRAGAILARVGNLVKENDTTLVTLLQMTPIHVSFSIPQQQLHLVQSYAAKHPVEVAVQVSGDTVDKGTLRFVDNTVNPNTGTVKLKAEFRNDKRQLWPGQFVDVGLKLADEEGRVVVPAACVQAGPNGSFVWVVGQDRKVAMRNVDVLRSWESNSVLGSGLRAGEIVVSEGQMRLKAGASVQVLKPQ